MKYSIHYFGASYCDSCKRVTRDMNTWWEPTIKNAVIMHDIDTDKHYMKKYKVMVIPTIIVLDESNNEVKRLTGQQITDDNLKQFNK